MLALKKKKEKKLAKKKEVDVTRFKCKVKGCGKGCNTKKLMKTHWKTRHLGIPEKRKSKMCKKCGRLFKRSTHLKFKCNVKGVPEYKT